MHNRCSVGHLQEFFFDVWEPDLSILGLLTKNSEGFVKSALNELWAPFWKQKVIFFKKHVFYAVRIYNRNLPDLRPETFGWVVQTAFFVSKKRFLEEKQFLEKLIAFFFTFGFWNETIKNSVEKFPEGCQFCFRLTRRIFLGKKP